MQCTCIYITLAGDWKIQHEAIWWASNSGISQSGILLQGTYLNKQQTAIFVLLQSPPPQLFYGPFREKTPEFSSMVLPAPSPYPIYTTTVSSCLTGIHFKSYSMLGQVQNRTSRDNRTGFIQAECPSVAQPTMSKHWTELKNTDIKLKKSPSESLPYTMHWKFWRTVLV